MNNKYGNRTKEGTAPVILDSETEFAAPCCKLEQHKLPLCEVHADIIVVQSTGACAHCAGFSQISRTVSVRMRAISKPAKIKPSHLPGTPWGSADVPSQTSAKMLRHNDI